MSSFGHFEHLKKDAGEEGVYSHFVCSPLNSLARLKEIRKREIKPDRLTIFKNINGKEGRNNLKEDNNNLPTSSKESALDALI